MLLEITSSTDLGLGAGPFAAIGALLLSGEEQFGGALELIEVTLAMPPIDDPDTWLAGRRDGLGLSVLGLGPSPEEIPWSVGRREYERERQALPKVVFRRSRARAEITVSSEIAYPEQWVEDADLVAEFAQGVDDVIGALELLRARLKPSDDFDLDALLAHCEAARARIPRTPQELQAVLDDSQRRWLARQEGQDGWEALDIDWAEYHSSARELLDDPFFWDVADDYAPHGNDTGADLLEHFKEALDGDLRLDTVAWTRRLLRSWGVSGDSDVAMLMRDEAWIAAAFAELKVRGRLAPELAREALASVDRLRRRPTDAGDDGDHEGKLAKIAERLNALM